jgi:hypothetical protein
MILDPRKMREVEIDFEKRAFLLRAAVLLLT